MQVIQNFVDGGRKRRKETNVDQQINVNVLVLDHHHHHLCQLLPFARLGFALNFPFKFRTQVGQRCSLSVKLTREVRITLHAQAHKRVNTWESPPHQGYTIRDVSVAAVRINPYSTSFRLQPSRQCGRSQVIWKPCRRVDQP